jgi:hypothetical protein
MSDSLREDYKSNSTPTLVLIASSSTSTYRVESIKAAQEELLARGESWQDEQVVADARSRAAEGEVDLSLTWENLMNVALIFFTDFSDPGLPCPFCGPQESAEVGRHRAVVLGGFFLTPAQIWILLSLQLSIGWHLRFTIDECGSLSASAPSRVQKKKGGPSTDLGPLEGTTADCLRSRNAKPAE